MQCQMRANIWQNALNPRVLAQGVKPRTHHQFSVTTVHGAKVNLPTLDEKWQRKWADTRSFRKEQAHAEKAYILPMFPYPSGSLHLGHLRVYTIADVLARFYRMQGKRVLYPMGWDAFGLPAENAAIERGIDPREWTDHNVKKMKEQLERMNADFDWSREFKTCDPEFYKHTQRLFLHLHEHSLAYQNEALVNYDPVDKTVLANEQVDADGRSWRSGAMVERVNLRQWFFRITKFKEELLQGLDILQATKGWPERVLTMQRNWLGKSQGAVIKFEILSTSGLQLAQKTVSVFTTRPDTLFGVQFIALSLSHPIVQAQAAKDPDLQQFLKSAKPFSHDLNTGYLLKGVVGTNPMSKIGGIHKVPDFVSEPLPVYAAPYVLDSYGEGAVMGVPGHDTRDNGFWKHHRGVMGIREVVVPKKEEVTEAFPNNSALGNPWLKPGKLNAQCGDYRHLDSDEAAARIVDNLQSTGFARHAENWRLRDWLISRQRYWGTPIPIIHCRSCGAVPVPVSDLPVVLPKLKSLAKARNPLESALDWVNTTCPKCQGPAKRETDTMDTFVDSSWYFMRFPDSQNTNQMFSPESAGATLPVDVYIGGVEHAILHLLYARFVAKFVQSIGLWPSGGGSKPLAEPFKQLITQGMVHGETFSDPQTGRFLKMDELDFSDPLLPKIKQSGEISCISWEKMSKSKHNGVDTTATLQKYGADALRAYMLFQAPATEVLRWEEKRIVGIQRWYGRLYIHVTEISKILLDDPELQQRKEPPVLVPSSLTKEDTALYTLANDTTASITTSLANADSFNTVISDLIKFTNALTSVRTSNLPLAYHSTSILLRLLAPVAPAFAEECWAQLHTFCEKESRPVGSIFDEPFPVVADLANATRRSQSCAVQENGKLRFAVSIPLAPENLLLRDAGAKLKEWVLAEIGKTEEGRKWFAKHADREWKRVVCVKGGKTVNFVG